MNVRLARLSQGVRSEVAVSLNSKDAQIFSKAGNDWKATETLSEVRAIQPLIPRVAVAYDGTAR